MSARMLSKWQHYQDTDLSNGVHACFCILTFIFCECSDTEHSFFVLYWAKLVATGLDIIAQVTSLERKGG